MHHGGDLALAIQRYGGSDNEWLDLSTGINPHAYPFAGDLTPSVWQRLPGQDALERLLEAARKAYRCPSHLGLVAAPGTQALISQLPSLLPGGDVAIVSPTYSSHGDAWRRQDRTVTEISRLEDLPETARLALVVNPNNPDGQVTDRAALLASARELSKRGGYLIIDEAFADILPEASVLPEVGSEPILVLRSFGKFFGLAGLRLGFLAGSKSITWALSDRLESWAVSGPALEIGRHALSDHDWQNAMRRQLESEMAELTSVLEGHGLQILGQTSLYVLVASPEAAALHEKLARHRIWTRVFDYAPTWIRFGLPGSAEGLARLREVLANAEKPF